MKKLMGSAAVAAALILAPFTAAASPATSPTQSAAHVAVAPQGVGSADVDCSDFPNQRAAQHYFLNHGGPQSDPDGLDADGDGIACESNPCPCDHSTHGGGGGGGGNPPAPPPVLHQQARVIRVVDGDTITVRLSSGGKDFVELIGVDAPTLRPKQCGAESAKNTLRNQLPRGTRVSLTSDRKLPVQTARGHLNRYVESRAHEAGRFQLLKGWGRADTGSFTRKQQYVSAVRSAQRHHQGIWGGCGH